MPGAVLDTGDCSAGWAFSWSPCTPAVLVVPSLWAPGELAQLNGHPEAADLCPGTDGRTFAEKGFTKKSWSDKWICLQI